MTRVAQLVPCLVEADAVGNDVLRMHRILQGRGHDVHIFASEGAADGVAVQHFSEIGPLLDDPDTLLIYHYTAGWRESLALLARARCKRVFRYHNVTPAEFYLNVSWSFVNVCWAGRQQLGAFARAGCERYLAASEYNLQELLSAGISLSTGAVVPPLRSFDGLQRQEPEPSVLEKYDDGTTNILTVGRLAPNKGHLRLIEAFALYHRDYNPDSRLLIVGKADDRLERYTRMLHARVTELGMDEAVVFMGGVSDRVLATCYRIAAVFLLTSYHEGFCVPLVEAMAMEVPIVALGEAAVPATVGQSGLVWQTAGPDILAESIHCLVTDGAARRAVVKSGWQRYQEQFAGPGVEARFLQALHGLL
jgi:glycosyltransferase involved in cell wall biosynthesis